MNVEGIDKDAVTESLAREVGKLQFALRVAYELAMYGPGTTPQIVDRMIQYDDEGMPIHEQWVDEALGTLDQWSLLDFSGLEDTDPVSLVGSRA